MVNYTSKDERTLAAIRALLIEVCNSFSDGAPCQRAIDSARKLLPHAEKLHAAVVVFHYRRRARTELRLRTLTSRRVRFFPPFFLVYWQN